MTNPNLMIRVAQPAEVSAALELVLTGLAPTARGPLVETLASQPVAPLGLFDGLMVAVDGEELVAAAWVQPSPGRAAAYWPPEWRGARPADAEPVESQLAAAAMARADEARVTMAQTLFETPSDPRITPLAGSGFRRIARLAYLGRAVSQIMPRPAGADRVEFASYTDTDHGRLKRLLQRTYIDSLDCPGLEGFRDLDDLLTSYRATGRYDPTNWLFLRSRGEDAGVLILAEHPDADQVELVYMGAVPEARGRGLGAILVAEAIEVAEGLGSDQLMVAVDEANAPAWRVYEKAGFAPWARREVYVRPRGGVA